MLSLIKPLITNLLLWIWIGTALFLWWITRRNKRFRRYGFCFLALFWVMSTRPVADGILLALESSYSAPAISSLEVQGIDQIVVLSGGGGLRTEVRRQMSEVGKGRMSEVRGREKTEVRGQRTDVREWRTGGGLSRENMPIL